MTPNTMPVPSMSWRCCWLSRACRETTRGLRYGDEGGAETLLICWGSTYLPCREAVDILRMRGHSAAMLHFAQIWPLDREAVKQCIGERKRVAIVEGNAWGQFASILREQQLVGDVELVTRYDGLPFTAIEIADRIEG